MDLSNVRRLGVRIIRPHVRSSKLSDLAAGGLMIIDDQVELGDGQLDHQRSESALTPYEKSCVMFDSQPGVGSAPPANHWPTRRTTLKQF
jgi:hypothetical protein